MRQIASGRGTFPLISLLAILSVSLTVNLPGLGISPIEGKLSHVFPRVTDLDIQLLTVLPNLVIIPVILLTGKISRRRNQTAVLAVGLSLFTLSGVGSMLAHSMGELIGWSCLLGVGCGLVIPLAASMVAQNFVGNPRTRWLGVKSGVANFSIILATLFAGWIATIDWHLPFAIYLLAAIPLLMLPWMSQRFIGRHAVEAPASATATAAAAGTAAKAPAPGKCEKKGENEVCPEERAPLKPATIAARVAALIALYVSLTYAVEVISYNMPFTMSHFGLNSTAVGVATSLFFLGITIGGFCLTQAIRYLGKATMPVSIALCVGGLVVMGIFHTVVSFSAAALIIGLGYGVIQPVIYDKTTSLANTSERSTTMFSYVLAGNYVGIAVTPFIVDFFCNIFHAHATGFAYIFNACFLALVLAVSIVMNHSFVFRISRHTDKR